MNRHDPRRATETARRAAEEMLRFGLLQVVSGPPQSQGIVGPTAHDSPAGFSPSPSGSQIGTSGPTGGGLSVSDDEFFEGEQRGRVRGGARRLVGARRLEFGSIDLGSIRPEAANTAYGMPGIADARMADQFMVYVRSTCNQAVTIQTVGGVSSAPNLDSVFNIEASQALAAGSTTQTVLALLVNLRDNWAPYLGITVAAGATAPTTGFVYAVAYLRVWQHIV